MKGILELYSRGGPVMIAITVLSVLLYSRCFILFLSVWRSHRQLRSAASGNGFLLRLQREDAEGAFQSQRVAVAAMIAAAPLLGLLGTVSGMAKTFETLKERGANSMEGLARGISEVLVATEAGLSVAIPAMILVYFAHRLSRRQVAAIRKAEELHRSSRMET
jgi:biopolymer transport protein ExbB